MFNDNRPRLKLKKDQTQNVLEVATFALIILATIYTIINYNSLPEQVPMHFNLSGKADSFGDKSFVWFPLIIGFALCFGVFKLNKYPHLFNYPNTITKDNAEKQYTNAVKMLSVVNFLMALLFAIVTYKIVSLGLAGEDKTSKWLEYVIYIVIGFITFVPLIWVIKSAFISNYK